ncbi:MAG TPA: MFS transporter, partial [Thermoanaerobaculia bacterium]
MLRDVPRQAWKVLFAAQIGWMLDAMDFLLFTFALRAIQKEFDLADATMGILTSVALIAGAIGGIAFGRLADAIGRVRAMTISMLVYSLATGALATSSSLGQLVLWRSIVGLGMGGEWSCGSVLVAETWPAKHRAKAIGIMQSGWAIGALAAAGLAAVVLEPYGWRVLFLIGAFPAVIALVIRRTIEEPAIWREQKANASEPGRFLELFSAEFIRRTVMASSLASAVLVAYWGLNSWLPAFLATPVEKGGAGLTLTKSATWMILVQVGAFLGYTTFGLLADRIGRRPAFTLFMVGASVTVPIYALLASNPAVLIVFGPLVGYFAHGYFSLFGAFLAELYPTRIRATAQGFCYNAGRLASAAAPFAIGLAATRHGL